MDAVEELFTVDDVVVEVFVEDEVVEDEVVEDEVVHCYRGSAHCGL